MAGMNKIFSRTKFWRTGILFYFRFPSTSMELYGFVYYYFHFFFFFFYSTVFKLRSKVSAININLKHRRKYWLVGNKSIIYLPPQIYRNKKREIVIRRRLLFPHRHDFSLWANSPRWYNSIYLVAMSFFLISFLLGFKKSWLCSTQHYVNFSVLRRTGICYKLI